jgi:tRNA uridine 5-carboxymethylaminomethyl modification enzyme
MKAMRDLLERTRVNEAVVSCQSAVVSEDSARTLDLLNEAKSSGQTLAQLLKRPEVRIEMLAPALAELMPQFFAREAELEGSNGKVPVSGFPPGNEQRVPPLGLKSSVGMTTSKEGELTAGDSVKLTTGNSQLTTAIRNELKSVETEIKYSGYLDQQTKAIERLKRSEQRMIPDWFDYAKVSGLSREMNEKLSRVRPQTLGQASRIPGVTPAAVSLINVFIEIQGRQKAAASL